MRTKRYIFLLLGFFVASANASFYITGGLGATQTTANWDIESSATYAYPVAGNPQQMITLPYTTTASEESQSFVGQLGLGYGLRFSERMFLGLEASIAEMASQPKINNTAIMDESYLVDTTTVTADLKSDSTLKVIEPDINLDLKLGVFITRYGMLYIKGGAVFNELTLESNTAFLYVNPNSGGAPKSFTSTITTTETEKVTGLHAALGIEQLISRYVAVNMEYVYVNYGDISVAASAPTTSTTVGGVGSIIITDPDGLKTDTSASVSRQGVMLGIIVYLGKQY